MEVSSHSNADLMKVIRPLDEVILKIWCSDQGHLLANCGNKREKFYPGLELEHGVRRGGKCLGR